jgi:hypothetical protein
MATPPVPPPPALSDLMDRGLGLLPASAGTVRP